MSAIEQKIMDELKTAMKSRDQVASDTLRSMKSALKYKMVEQKVDELSDEVCYQVFQSLIKQRRDSVEQYESSGKSEAAEKEKREIEIISKFLPQPLSTEELEALISEAVEETGASSPKDMGAVMKALKPKVTGRAEGKTVSELVKSKLASS